MNTRVSQFELRPSVEPDSNRAESFPSQPKFAAEPFQDQVQETSERAVDGSRNFGSKFSFYLIGLLLTATPISKLWMSLNDSFSDVRARLKKILWFSSCRCSYLTEEDVLNTPFSRSIFRTIILILSLTSLLKIWSVSTDQFADIKSGMHIFLLWMVIACETFVIWIMVRKNYFRTKVIVSFLLFSGFLISSIARKLLGFQSCGCVGSIAIPTGLSIVVNCLVLMSLLPLLKSSLTTIWASPKRIVSHDLLDSLGTPFGMLLAFALFATIQAGYGHSVVNAVLGNVPIVVSDRVHLGEIVVGEFQRGEVVLVNNSENDIKVIGEKKSCNCITQDVSDVVIPARGSIHLEIFAKPNSAGFFHHRVLYYLNSSQQYVVAVDVVASVKAKTQGVSLP